MALLMTDEGAAPLKPPRRPAWLTLPLGVTFTAVATTSMVADGIVPALPALQRELHASTDAMGWFYTAPMLAAVVCTPVVARLAAVLDKRRVLDGVLALLFVGMLLSASAQGAPMLILGQLLSGASLSLLPLSVGLISDSCDPVSARTANAIVAALGALTPCIGLMICGPIVDHLSFRWLFWGPAILLGACLVASLLFRRQGEGARPATTSLMDWKGAALLSCALGCGLLTISRLSESTSHTASQWGLAAIACASAAAWVSVERRVAAPLFDLRLLFDRVAISSGGCMFAAGYLIIGVSLGVPMLGELPPEHGGLGASVTQTSEYFLALAVVGTAITPFVNRVGRLLGSRNLMSLAMLVLSAAALDIALATPSHRNMLVAMSTIGAAFSVVLVESMNAIVAAFRSDESTAASGLAWVLKSIGATLGGQLTAAIVAIGAARGDGSPSATPIVIALAVASAVGAAGVLVARCMPARAAEKGVR